MARVDEILGMVAKGLTHKQIAEHYGVSTVFMNQVIAALRWAGYKVPNGAAARARIKLKAKLAALDAKVQS